MHGGQGQGSLDPFNLMKLPKELIDELRAFRSAIIHFEATLTTQTDKMTEQIDGLRKDLRNQGNISAEMRNLANKIEDHKSEVAKVEMLNETLKSATTQIGSLETKMDKIANAFG